MQGGFIAEDASGGLFEKSYKIKKNLYICKIITTRAHTKTTRAHAKSINY